MAHPWHFKGLLQLNGMLAMSFLKWLMFLLMISLVGSSAWPAFSCLGAHTQDPFERWRKESNRVFRANLHGDAAKGEKELYFYWHTGLPMNLQKTDTGKYALVPSGKRMRTYQNHSDPASEHPLQVVNTLMGRQDTTNVEMVEAFIENFKDRGSPQIIAAIKELEEMIANMANPRQSFGLVATAPVAAGGKVLGTFRVLNGIPSQSNTPAYLAFEYLFRVYGVRSKTVELLEKLRHDPNALILEIGKFSIDAPPEVVDRVRNLLELFLLRYYIDTYPPETNYFVHCVSKAHVRRYEQRYGLRVIEEVHVPGKGTVEYILSGTGHDLRQAFSKLHAIPEPGIEISGP